MKVIAHRGASFLHHENTIDAFRTAFNSTCDGIELDVRITKDNKLVVYHDFLLQENPINTYQLDEIQKIDSRVITLDKALKIIGDKHLFLEIKDHMALPLCIKKINKKTTTIISFNPRVIVDMNKYYPEYRKGLIVECYHNIFKNFIHDTNCDILVSSKTWMTAELSKQIELPIYIYTVNSILEKERLDAMGVTGIISDRIGLFCTILG